MDYLQLLLLLNQEYLQNDLIIMTHTLVLILL
nr:MAG TPA: hypothetical protein [Bacteriophage sp.]